eukprot:5118564-Karenia_brevis.AAC.1
MTKSSHREGGQEEAHHRWETQIMMRPHPFNPLEKEKAMQEKDGSKERKHWGKGPTQHWMSSVEMHHQQWREPYYQPQAK